MLKIHFHLHTSSDPEDAILHNEFELIDRASEQQCDVLSFTLHNKFLFSEELESYAAQKGILLIPGIEKTIENKHVLIINATQETEKIETFEQLREYRHHHPECFTIAAHPFYPTNYCLGEKLLQHLELFDAVEYSWYFSKSTQLFNQKAENFAKKYHKPLVTTADNHLLQFLNFSYLLVDAEKTPQAIFKAIKAGKLKRFNTPLSTWKLFTIFMTMEWMQIKTKFRKNQQRK